MHSGAHACGLTMCHCRCVMHYPPFLVSAWVLALSSPLPALHPAGPRSRPRRVGRRHSRHPSTHRRCWRLRRLSTLLTHILIPVIRLVSLLARGANAAGLVVVIVACSGLSWWRVGGLISHLYELWGLITAAAGHVIGIGGWGGGGSCVGRRRWRPGPPQNPTALLVCG